MDLVRKKCAPCKGGAPPIQGKDIDKYLGRLGSGWIAEAGTKIKKEFSFASFKDAIDFVMRVARLAESENHHPDILIFYKWVTIQSWTRAVGGLSENDFILAAKIEKLIRP